MQIVPGGCTSGPPFGALGSRRGKENRVARPKAEATNQEPRAGRIWRALRRMLRKARPGA